MNTATQEPAEIDFRVPDSGAARDAYDVAVTTLKLYRRKPDMALPLLPARHALILHRASGALHRLDETRCNVGDLSVAQQLREARIVAECEQIAAIYGMETYYQGDPRGCALYLTEPGEKDYTNGHAVTRLGR